VQLTNQFGTSRTLSSPRLHAINNQQAVLTFAENRIFFDLDIEQEDALVQDGVVVQQGGITVESETVSIPIGIILSIIPSINLDTSEVTLNIRPTLSRQVDQVADPVAAFASADTGTDIQNNIPVVEVRELDSVMKLRSGQVLVIGGLMQDVVVNSDQGVPGLSEIPWIGKAFKSQLKQNGKSELIIFIKATIVDSNGHAQDADRYIYEKFTDDPRPISF